MVKQHFYIFFLVALLLLFAVPNVLADDDKNNENKYEEEYNHETEDENAEDDENESMEEIGEFLGWSAIFFATGAGLIHPVRRLAPSFLGIFPNFKQKNLFFLRLLKKWHPVFGFFALSFAIFHGVTMYQYEGYFGLRELIGVVAIILFLLAFLIGLILLKIKTSVLRRIHSFTIFTAGFLVLIHLLLD